MRRLAMLNQKGGVGKTTTAVNLGAALALRGRRVLLVDLDPQGNLTDHLGVEVAEDTVTIYEVLTQGAKVEDAVRPTATEGLEVVPSREDLAAAEIELGSVRGREVLLRNALDALAPDRYDWLLVDCPPSLGLLSLNAMAACPEVFITLQTEYFALRGLGQLSRIVAMVRRDINPALRIAGILPTLVKGATNLAREVIEEVLRHFGDVVLQTRIRQNVRLAEAPGHRKHIFDYAPQSAGARDYRALADELEGARAKPPAPADEPEAAGPASGAEAAEAAPGGARPPAPNAP